MNKAFILSVFSNNEAESITINKRFVAKEALDESNQIFDRRKLPSVVGSKQFIDTITNKFFTGKNFEEVSESRSLSPDVDSINAEVCSFHSVNNSDIYGSRRGYCNEPRNAAIYLIR